LTALSVRDGVGKTNHQSRNARANYGENTDCVEYAEYIDHSRRPFEPKLNRAISNDVEMALLSLMHRQTRINTANTNLLMPLNARC
jgi:hypothetical protein